MKNLLILLLAISLFSCNTNKDTKQKDQTHKIENLKENALLYNQVTIRQEIDFLPELNKDWKRSLVDANLLQKIIDGAIDGKPVYDLDLTNTMNVEDIKISLGQISDTMAIEDLETGEFTVDVKLTPYDIKSIYGIYFYENWAMDSNLTSFTKSIIQYSPVREFVNQYEFDLGLIDKLDTAKFLAFFVVNNDNSENYKEIAKNVMSEFYFKQEYADIRIQGLNIPNLQKLILDNVLSQKVKTYSFNDFNEELKIKDVKEIIGATTDTLLVEDLVTHEFSTKITENKPDKENIIGLIFIENWMFDNETMMIKKNVVGIAPIWKNMIFSDSGDVMESKLIPFVIKF
jgi:hypothetical protein